MATDAAAEAVAIPVEDHDELKIAAEKIKADSSRQETKIHRIPANMRDLANDGMHYFVPNVVAIGPYHHGLPHLLVLEAEDVKRAAAYYFCIDSGQSVEVVYEKILSVAGEARSCYADDAVAGIPEADFAAMMFHDGCFLLQFIMYYTDGVDQSLLSWFRPNLASILRDIFLLENQIPWLVLKALMDLRPVAVRVDKFIVKIGANLSNVFNLKDNNHGVVLDRSFAWPNLLGLLRYYIVSGSMTDEIEKHPKFRQEITSFSVTTTSAIELEEIGIRVTTSRTTEFKLNHIGIEKGCLFMTPFVLDEVRACWLLNMTALEVSIAMFFDASGTGVSSYIALLAMLMNKEEDVHKLRAKGLVQGNFSDQETLKFFKSLAKHIHGGAGFFQFFAELEAYKRKRWMWIHIHKFVYNNFNTIITLFSIIVSVVGVLVPVLKILLSMK